MRDPHWALVDCRFHALCDKVDRAPVLMHACNRCHASGAAAVDGQTFADTKVVDADLRNCN